MRSDPTFNAVAIGRLHADILFDLGRMEESLQAYESAAIQAAGDPHLSNGAGNALLELGRAADAKARFDRAIALDPTVAIFYLNRALALIALARAEDCLRDCERARSLGVQTSQLYFVEGLALTDLCRQQDAIAAYDEALVRQPDHARSLNNRGVALSSLGRHEEAVQSFNRCLTVLPRDDKSPIAQQARLNLCGSLKSLGRRLEAAQGLEELVRLAPELDGALGMLHHERLAQHNWTAHDATVAALRQGILEGRRSDTPFSFLAVADDGPLQLCCARAFQRLDSPAGVTRKPVRPASRQRLRIGYLSSDLREHAVAILMAGVFENHDRSRFETTAFSTGAADSSDVRRRLEKSCDHFLDASRLQDSALAERILESEIDILVDLNGPTLGGRPGVHLLRPAAISASYLGFPGTTGNPHVDYILADDVLITPDTRPDYSESVVYLPHCFQANDSRRLHHPPLSRIDEGLPEDVFIYCCHNAPYKINPAMFDAWCRILAAVPDSVLWLVKGVGSSKDNLIREAAARGIGRDRLVFAEHRNYPRHLARLALADLFLDTLPFNGGTTVSDALWAALPVLAVRGRTFSARMAASLLTAVAMPELICANLADYEAKAIDLGTNLPLVNRHKAYLAQQRTANSLFDSTARCRALEAAYEMMWARLTRGESPGDLVIRVSN